MFSSRPLSGPPFPQNSCAGETERGPECGAAHVMDETAKIREAAEAEIACAGPHALNHNALWWPGCTVP